MANHHNQGGAGVLVAFVAGVVAGAALALLFAPASGEETRRNLGERAREVRDRAREQYEAARRGDQPEPV